jgi:hypothetical protein
MYGGRSWVFRTVSIGRSQIGYPSAPRKQTHPAPLKQGEEVLNH